MEVEVNIRSLSKKYKTKSQNYKNERELQYASTTSLVAVKFNNKSPKN
jgi:hypothetical protein